LRSGKGPAGEWRAGAQRDDLGYPALFEELMRRGWSDDDCAKLAGRNALRALADAEVSGP
jgi:microsomal dipeptidase-like Zn-dependent dipeptidase